MQRLLITIPILVVMLSGCGNKPTDLTGPGDGTLDSTVLDSDGDGFSDDAEVSGVPGTDPFDATDNPNNVRDTDGDGCSDYDELTLDGSCDNDPNTPVSGTCDVAYYNSEFSYGFDLPLGADLNITDIPNTLFAAGWTVDRGHDIVQISPFVQFMQGISVSLSDLVDELNSLRADAGAVFLADLLITLSNGDAGNLSIYMDPTMDPIGVITYSVMTIKHGRNYTVLAIVIDDLAHSTDAVLTEVVSSLCVD